MGREGRGCLVSAGGAGAGRERTLAESNQESLAQDAVNTALLLHLWRTILFMWFHLFYKIKGKTNKKFVGLASCP